MSSGHGKRVNDEDLREVFFDLVETEPPDEEELRALAEVSGLEDEDVRADWRAVEARLEDAAREAARPQPEAQTPSVAPVPLPHPVIAPAPRSWMPLAASFALGVAAALLLVFAWPVSSPVSTPLADPPAVAYLEPVAERDVLRGGGDEGVAPGRRLLLFLAPPTAADLGAEPPERVGYVLRDATAEAVARGEAWLQRGEYLVEIPAGTLKQGTYDLVLRGESGEVVASYELEIDAADAAG